MNQVLPMIKSLKPPKASMEMDETVLMEAGEACPALHALLSYPEGERDPWTWGVIHSLYAFYTNLSGVDQEELLTEVNPETLNEVDSTLSKEAELIISQLPNILKYMKEDNPNEDAAYKAGVVCAFATVLVVATSGAPESREEEDEEDEPEKETVKVSSPPKDEEEKEEKVVATGDSAIRALLSNLHKEGLDISCITIRPALGPGEKIKLNVTGNLGSAPNFDQVSRINNLFKKVGGRDITLAAMSNGSIWYSYDL